MTKEENTQKPRPLDIWLRSVTTATGGGLLVLLVVLALGVETLIPTILLLVMVGIVIITAVVQRLPPVKRRLLARASERDALAREQVVKAIEHSRAALPRSLDESKDHG